MFDQMFDQLIIGNVGSLENFDATVAEREVLEPKKKSIKETVPFSNKTYDYTKMNGEIYWEERTLKYKFEIIADSPEKLEEKKTAFKSWVMNVCEEELFDPFIKDYHFIATYDDINSDDSEIEKSTIEVTFTAYPYKIANEETIYKFELVANEEKTVEVLNDSSHRITPTFKTDKSITVTIGSDRYSVPSGETMDDYFKLEAGATMLKFVSIENCTVTVSFFCEVF